MVRRQSASSYRGSTASSAGKLPISRAWSSGTVPRPLVPVSTPAPHDSARATTSAPAWRAPPPAQMRGRRDSRSTAAARAMSRSAPVRSVSVRSGTVFCSSGFARYCRSMGQSTLTGPEGAEDAS